MVFQLGEHDLYCFRINFLFAEISKNAPMMRYEFQSLGNLSLKLLQEL
jgi:hypothetical protein